MYQLTLVFCCIGLTKIADRLGIQGMWLLLVCTLLGAGYSYLTTYHPSLWHASEGVFLAAAAWGNVALVSDLRQPLAGH